MFRIYKKNKNVVKWVSFVLIGLVILSFLNFNNVPYANVNEGSDPSDQSNTEFTDFEENEPKAAFIYIDAGGIIQNQIYNTDNVKVRTGDPVTFINCIWTSSWDLYLENGTTNCDVSIDLSSLNTIYVDDDGTQLSVTNSTLSKIIDKDYVDNTGYYECINCTFREDEQYQIRAYHASVDLTNCTFYHSVNIRNENTVNIIDCRIYGTLNLAQSSGTVTAVVSNCEINNIIIPNGDVKIQDCELRRFQVYINSSLNETLELKSHTPNVVLSNVKIVDPLPGQFTIITINKYFPDDLVIFNMSNVREELLSRIYINQNEGSELYIKNSFVSKMINRDGVKVSNHQNSTFLNSIIQSNNTLFSNCTIRNIMEVDTNAYSLGGSNKPFKIENSNFVDILTHVKSGGVDIDNCDYKTEMGVIWLDTTIYEYAKKKDTFVFINNSNPKVINQGLNTSLIAENLDCNSITMRDTSHSIFNNVNVGTMNVLDSATATIDNCHINSHNFESPNVQITNSIVDSMAPTLDTIPSPLNDLKNFNLNWSIQPGKNLTGNIVSYEVFRAEMGIGGATPSPTDFTSIYTDSIYPFDTEYNDTDIANYDGYEVYYTVEITDEGGNSGNSTILSTVYDTGISFDYLDATVIFDDSLTTYDDILVSVFMIDADINDNGTQDVGNATLQCQFKYGSTIINQAIESTGDSINGIVYYFLIPQTLTATEITFSIQIEQNKYYDAQGVGLYNFNSTTKYGKPFTIKKPIIAFNPVDHPSGDKILTSKRIKLYVSAVSNAQYISTIKVYYREDGGDWESKTMSYDSGELEYTVKLPEFEPCTLEYYAKCIDIAGNEYELLGSKDDPETIEIIPDFPRTQLETFDLAIIFIGSALVGIVFGFAYVLLDLSLKKHTTLKRTQKLKTFFDYPDKSKKAPAKKTPAKKTPAKSASAKKKAEGK